LIFQVVDEESKGLLGWYSVPVNCIREGYRVIPLKNQYMYEIVDSYLLVHSQFD